MSTARAACAAYDATAAMYAELVGTEISPATEAPIDRGLLATFVDLVAGSPTNRVADVGCGPGRVAAFLAAHGVEVVGVDMSHGMLALARNAHPGIHLQQALLTALPILDRHLAGAVCWYSIIHTPPELLADVGAELSRVLAPDGHLLVAFQAGNGEPVHRAEICGTEVSLTSYRHSPDAVALCLTEAGLHVHARATREPEFAHESTPQAFILARAGSPGR